jgi:hypothetical protein
MILTGAPSRPTSIQQTLFFGAPPPYPVLVQLPFFPGSILMLLLFFSGVRCSQDRGHSALRLQCGAECEANELVAVAESRGKALVLHGSFTSSEVCCWNLSPPHQWGRSDWHPVTTLSLAQTLRLSGQTWTSWTMF